MLAEGINFGRQTPGEGVRASDAEDRLGMEDTSRTSVCLTRLLRFYDDFLFTRVVISLARPLDPSKSWLHTWGLRFSVEDGVSLNGHLWDYFKDQFEYVVVVCVRCRLGAHLHCVWQGTEE